MIYIGFTVWNGYFSQRFSDHCILEAMKAHSWLSRLSMDTGATQETQCPERISSPDEALQSLRAPSFPSSLFLCRFNLLILDCLKLTSIYCLKSSLSSKTHPGQALFPRIKSHWLILGPSENFHGWQAIINPCGNWSRWKHLSRKCLENTREKDY